MTAADRPDNGQDAGPVLVARCGNYREDLDQPCTGTLHFRWGMIQAVCDTCGGWCGVAVARWTEVASGRAGAGEPQRVVAVIEESLWQREQFTLDIPNEPGHRLAWAAGAGPFIRGLADELLALLGGPHPDGEAVDAVAAARACWCAHCEGIVLAADHPTNWVARIGGRRFIVCRDCGDKRCPRAAHHDAPCAYREPCPVYSHDTDGWHCAVTGDHDQHTNAAWTVWW